MSAVFGTPVAARYFVSELLAFEFRLAMSSSARRGPRERTGAW